MVNNNPIQVNEHSMVGIVQKLAPDVFHSTSNHVELQYESCGNTQLQVTTSSSSIFKSNSVSQEISRDGSTEILPYQKRTVTFQRLEGL